MHVPDDMDKLLTDLLKPIEGEVRAHISPGSLCEKDAFFAYAVFGKIMTGTRGLLVVENVDGSMDYLIQPGDEETAISLLTRLINRLASRIADRNRGV